MNTKTIEQLEPDSWVNLTAEVQELWDNEHPAIRQVGLLKDDTGIVKFVSWEKSGQPLLQLGVRYELIGIHVNPVYEDRVSIALVSVSKIIRLDPVDPVQLRIPAA